MSCFNAEMYKDMRDPLIVARFNAVIPAIGLGGSRPDGFEYFVPRCLPAELVWTIECRAVTFWYPSDPDQKRVFSGLDLIIPHGQTVGIWCGPLQLVSTLQHLENDTPCLRRCAVGRRAVESRRCSGCSPGCMTCKRARSYCPEGDLLTV